MEGILNRLRALRAFLGLKQGEFSKRLKMPQNSYSQIETGINPLKDRHIALICLTFGVNESWLRTGDGEMFTRNTNLKPNEPIIGPNGEVLGDDEAELIWIYRKLSPANREIVTRHIDILFELQIVSEEEEKTG